MKTSLPILFLFGLIISCAQGQDGNQRNYTLVDQDGIMVEQFDSTVTDENRFTKDNKVFRAGVSFRYDFEHLDTSNEKFFFKYIDSLAYWEFVPEEEADDWTIRSVIISVKKGLQGFDTMMPDYNQSILFYNYPTALDYAGSINSASGVIENEANIWMHPPRDQYFEILELNPFPYIKSPYEVGTKWTWSLGIGDHWADGRWKLWSGSIENNYVYEIVDFRKIATILGELECYVVEANASSRIGETHLRSFFNPQYGFVRMEYTNIDGSKTNLILSKYLDLSEH